MQSFSGYGWHVGLAELFRADGGVSGLNSTLWYRPTFDVMEEFFSRFLR
jgi:hypothetical protein